MSLAVPLLGEEAAGGNAGHRAEMLDEMGLVVEACVVGELRQAHVGTVPRDEGVER